MKKLMTLVLAFSFLSTATLQAQQTGDGAASSIHVGKNNRWQGYLSAGGALLAATVGMVAAAVAGNSTTTSHSH